MMEESGQEHKDEYMFTKDYIGGGVEVGEKEWRVNL